MTRMQREGTALRARLGEAAWAEVWAAAEEPPLARWARPWVGTDDAGTPTGDDDAEADGDGSNAGDGDGDGDGDEAELDGVGAAGGGDGEAEGDREASGDGAATDGSASSADGVLIEALASRHQSVLAVEVASTAGGVGLLGEVATDLATVVAVARRVHVPDGASATGATGVLGVEVGVTTVAHLLGEVLRLLPPAPDPADLEEVELPEEHTVALGRALRLGDTATVSAICAGNGVAAAPEVLRALALDLRGSVVVTVARRGGGLVLGQWMLTGRGYVEVVRTSSATIRHVPCSRADIGRSVLTAVTGAASAVCASGGSDG
ncbi:MAG: hypothetical protein ACRCYX_00910 [Dermatophilaceae bacterium]